MTHFAIAGLQLALAPNKNLDLVIKKTRGTLARFPFVQMVVVSELAICGVAPSTAEALPSDTESKLCALAKELGIWFIPGSLFEKENGKIYNTVPVINPDGEVVTRYRKMYPFYPYENGTEAGSEIGVFDVPNVGRFGISNCFDIWFPEHSRAMIRQGAEVILHPSLTNTQDRDAEHAILRATAVQQQCYIVDVNGGGSLGWGQSHFVGPECDVIHAATCNEEVMLIEVDFDRVRRVRERGHYGLGQPLKSFRDAGHDYSTDNSIHLDSLGALEVPLRGK